MRMSTERLLERGFSRGRGLVVLSSTARQAEQPPVVGGIASPAFPRIPVSWNGSCNNLYAYSYSTSSSSSSPRRSRSSLSARPLFPRSSSSTSSNANLDLEYQRQSTQRLLNYAVGTFTPETWFEADALLLFWYRQRTVESVQRSLELLDRLVHERCPTLSAEVIHHVLNNWRVVWWQLDTHQSETLSSPTSSFNAAGSEESMVYGDVDPEMNDDKQNPDRRAVSSSADTMALAVVREWTPRHMFARILDYHQRFNVAVTEKTFYLILEASVSNGEPVETAHLAQDVFDTCLQLHQQTGQQDLLPSTDLANLVMRALASALLPDAALQCETLLDRMTQLQITINRRTYLRLLQAYVNTETAEGALAAEQVLRRMWSEYKQGCVHVEPSYSVYAAVIQAWARSGSREAVARGEALLQEMRSLDSPVRRKEIPVFNALLQCHANQGTSHSARRALELLVQQEKSDQKPNFYSYYVVLNALSQVGDADRAERLLGRVPEKFLNTILFTTVVAAWARSRHPKSAERARALVDRMKRLAKQNSDLLPNLYTYNALLDCYTKNHAPSFSCTAATLLVDEMVAEGIEPDRVTYSTLLHAWAQFGLAKRAVEILERIPNPDIHCYNIVLSAYVRAKDSRAPIEALKLLRSMSTNGITPDNYSYTSVISSFANFTGKNRTEAARQANALLREMQQLYQQGHQDMRPTLVTYNAVMNAYGRAFRPDHAEQVLQEMYHDYLNNGNTQARPDISSFNTLLKSWAIYKDKGKARDKVQDIFARMEALSSTLPEVTPNMITYTTVILAYGLVGEPKLADAVFRKLEKLHAEGKIERGPTKKTYRTLRKAWSSSDEPNKEERVAEIYREMDVRFGSSSDDVGSTGKTRQRLHNSQS